MERRWDSAHPLFIMGSITHPGHKSLSWLTPNQQQKGIDQLFVEMKNVSGSEGMIPGTNSSCCLGTPATKHVKLTLSEQAKMLFSFNISPSQSQNTEDMLSDELKRYVYLGLCV